MTGMTEDIIYIAAAVLLPLIPAYILYRTLPARTSVQGPFKGLNIKLSGAFGGYFLLVLVVFTFIFSRPRPAIIEQIIRPYEVYKVEGLIDTPNKQHLEHLALSLQPSGLSMRPNGRFDFEIPVKQGQTGREEFPSLVIDHPEYETETVELRDDLTDPSIHGYSIEYDKKNKVIHVKGTIRLRRKDAIPTYSPNEIPQPLNEDSEDK